jgi:hypothetical protein
MNTHSMSSLNTSPWMQRTSQNIVLFYLDSTLNNHLAMNTITEANNVLNSHQFDVLSRGGGNSRVQGEGNKKWNHPNNQKEQEISLSFHSLKASATAVEKHGTNLHPADTTINQNRNELSTKQNKGMHNQL